MDAVRVMIVDDHEIVRQGLLTLLVDQAGIEVVGQAGDGTTALALAVETQPHVVLMDLMMPEMDGIAATQALRRVSPESQVIMLTTFAGEEYIRRAMQAGAKGYLLKDVRMPELVHAIHLAAQGQMVLHAEVQHHLLKQISGAQAEPSYSRLTERERDVLRLIVGGKSNKQIAHTLHLTEGTVKGYVSTILEKLGVEDRTQAALYAVRHGLNE